MGNKIIEHLNHPSMHASGQITKSVSVKSKRKLWKISSHRQSLQRQQQQLYKTYRSIGKDKIRHVATSESQRENESTAKDYRSQMLVVTCCGPEHVQHDVCVCVLFVMVFR